MSGKTNGYTKKGSHHTPEFSFRQQEKSLAEVDRLFEDAGLPAPILLRRTLHSMAEGGLDIAKVEVGIIKQWINPGSTLDSAVKQVFLDFYKTKDKTHDLVWTAEEITFTGSSGVPVSVAIIDKSEKYFQHLDTRSYEYVFGLDFTGNGGIPLAPFGVFHLPNPYKEYLKENGFSTTSVTTDGALFAAKKEFRDRIKEEERIFI